MRIFIFLVLMTCTLLPRPATAALVKEDAERQSLAGQVSSLISAKRYADLDKLAASLQKGRFYGGGSKLLAYYNALSTGDAPQRPALIARQKAWLAANPNSLPARVALADIYADWAWDARGSGYANTVTDEGWKLFDERLNLSRHTLAAAEKFGKDPELYTSRITVAMGLNEPRSTAEAAFREAVRIDPEYWMAYGTMATYLLPRWHGKPGDLEKFMDDSRRRLGPGLGDEVYFRTTLLIQRFYHGKIFTETRIEWNLVKQGFVASDRRHPNSFIIVNNGGMLATMAQDQATAHDLLDRIGTSWDPDLFHSLDYYNQLRRWAGLPSI